jgi:hypothetical protein
MPNRSLNTAAILLTLSFALSACQSTPEDERPLLMVSASQNEALIEVMTDVLNQAAERQSGGAFVGWNSLNGMLMSEDPRIRSILDEAQWDNYDTYQRDYLTDQLFSFVDRGRPKGFSPNDRGGGYSQPIPGITFSSPGM